MKKPTPAIDPHDAARDAQAFAAHAARLLSDSKCEEALVLDVRGMSQITDFFVIATGTSDRQIASVASELKDLAYVEGRGVLGSQGEESGEWVVVDFVDVMVHLFAPEIRGYYDLESLWADAPRVSWQSQTKPGQFAKVGGSRAARKSAE